MQSDNRFLDAAAKPRSKAKKPAAKSDDDAAKS